jgi:kynurenine 3-monooxygenase
MDFGMAYIKHGYKELTIPPKIDAQGVAQYAMNPWQGLHIWPRDQFMLIALPNPDKSFTATLFFPLEGPDSLELVDAGGPPAILAYFQRHFPDVIPLIPDLVTDYQTSPNSALLQIKCDTYHAPGARVAILGDAAHACVPFYGQGMNAAFEDCLLLSEIMEEMDMDVSKALPEFTRRRARAGQALADLSFENYIEMRHHTASTLFLLRKRIESVFQRLSGGRWLPQYSMVAFTRTPYDEVVRRARKQDRVIETMARSIIVVAGAATVWGITALVKRNYPDALPQVNFSVTWPRWASSLTSSSNTTRATVRK